MGTTCTRIPSYYASKRDYLDKSVCTWDNTDSKGTVLKSAMVGAIYYAAIEKIDKGTGERIVFAAVIKTSSHPHASDGLTFCYKDMDETVGPCYYDCPVGILNLLTPTASEYATNWRAKCAEQRQSVKAVKVEAPKPGTRIRLAEAVTFTDQRSLTDFAVVAITRKGRSRTVYRSLQGGGLYRIPKIGARAYSILPAPAVDDGKSTNIDF